MSKRKDGQYGVSKVGRTSCIECGKTGHKEDFEFCLTCGSYVCEDHKDLHKSRWNHIPKYRNSGMNYL